MSMQEPPHDGVAALAVPALSAPAMPTPPTRVSVAAEASTLLLMDIKQVPLVEHSRTLRTAVALAPAALGTLPTRGGLIRSGTADLICLPGHEGKTRASPEASLERSLPTRESHASSRVPGCSSLTVETRD